MLVVFLFNFNFKYFAVFGMFLCSGGLDFGASVTKHDNGYYIFLITLIKSSHIIIQEINYFNLRQALLQNLRHNTFQDRRSASPSVKKTKLVKYMDPQV